MQEAQTSVPHRWLGFGCSSALTRTIVHFFPSSGSVSAPYPATVKLGVFSPEWGEKRVVLEGARLSQPDGVRVEDAFPMLADPRPGWFGILVEVSTLESKVDLGSSQCIIELAGKGRSTRYFPRALGTAEEDESTSEGSVAVPGPAAGLLIRDSFLVSSVLVVNASSETLTPALEYVNAQNSESPLVVQHTSSLVGGSVLEIGGEDSSGGTSLMHATGSREPMVQSMNFGSIRQQVVSASVRTDHSAYFVLYREVLSRRPVAAVEF